MKFQAIQASPPPHTHRGTHHLFPSSCQCGCVLDGFLMPWPQGWMGMGVCPHRVILCLPSPEGCICTGVPVTAVCKLLLNLPALLPQGPFSPPLSQLLWAVLRDLGVAHCSLCHSGATRNLVGQRWPSVLLLTPGKLFYCFADNTGVQGSSVICMSPSAHVTI